MFAIVFAMVIGIAITTAAVAVATSQTGAGPAPVPPALIGAILITYVIAILLGNSILTSRLHNAVWNETRLGGHRFTCNISWWRLFGVQFTNLLGTILTLGLYRPFAQIRLARFFAGAFELRTAGAIDDMRAAEGMDISAVGEEAAGFFDLDMGF
jgi:uncharacterized membrane protein YjgN (DUF898 family)